MKTPPSTHLIFLNPYAGSLVPYFWKSFRNSTVYNCWKFFNRMTNVFLIRFPAYALILSKFFLFIFPNQSSWWKLCGFNILIHKKWDYENCFCENNEMTSDEDMLPLWVYPFAFEILDFIWFLFLMELIQLKVTTHALYN